MMFEYRLKTVKIIFIKVIFAYFNNALRIVVAKNH